MHGRSGLRAKTGTHLERRTIGMLWEQKVIDEHQKRRDDADNLYCKLFADDVPKNICALRKRELNGRGEFTCVGCSWATL